ncbi:MAG TPA: DUF4386 domain-containing protein [Propionicimonas sp.]|nr:DUF4386 domain-containing protein [Propionicimonas sp.]
MLSEITDRVARPTLARITGGSYLLFIVLSVLADLLAHIGLGNAQQIHGSLTTSPGAFRAGLVSAFASSFFFLIAAWGLFVLLRTVSRDLALLFLLLNLAGVAVQCASMLHLMTAMVLAGPSGGLDTAQAESLALVAIEVYRTGFVAAQLFYGTWLFPLGYLVIRSGFLPRLLGVLLILDGVAEMVWFLQAFLLPAYPAIKTPGTLVSLLAEVGLTLWLLVRGVKVEPAAAPESLALPLDAGAPSR